MKKFLFKGGRLLQSLVPYVHMVLTMWLLYAVSVQGNDMSTMLLQQNEIEAEVSCGFFMNVEEFVNGHKTTYSTGVGARSREQIELEFQKQVVAEGMGCSSGACIDSARITIFQDCTGNYDIVTFRDTLIDLTQK